MGERGSAGGSWGAREEAGWWPGGGGGAAAEEEAARSGAGAGGAHQLFSYKMGGGFASSPGGEGGGGGGGEGDGSSPGYEYRLMAGAGSRSGEAQQPWWYTTVPNDSQQESPSSTEQEQSSPQSQSGSGHGQNLQQQLNQQQTLQQTLQQNQQQALHQQQLQQNLQQNQQQQTLQQALLQQAVQQHQTLQEHIQAVQQQHIQAALQHQQPTLQELQQQVQQQHILQQQALLVQAANNKARMPRGRADNKPRGRMTAYAFFVQTCREEHKKKHPDENVIFAAFSKKCAERWNTMLDKEKSRFHEMAEQDKKRYDLEMQTYVPPKGEKMIRGRKRKQMKDPNAPKRSLSAFFWFCNEERKKVKAINPEYGMGDIAKELGRRWAACDPETKSKFEALSEQDKARYDREMTAYKKKPLMVVPTSPTMMTAHIEEVEEDIGEGEDDY